MFLGTGERVFPFASFSSPSPESPSTQGFCLAVFSFVPKEFFSLLKQTQQSAVRRQRMFLVESGRQADKGW